MIFFESNQTATIVRGFSWKRIQRQVNKSNQQFKTKDLQLENIVAEIENTELEYQNFTSNISNEEPNDLKDAIHNPDIIFKPTGKGGGLVLMDKSCYQYSLVINRHLKSNLWSSLLRSTTGFWRNSFSEVKILCRKYRRKLTKRKVDYLINFKFQSSNTHCTPKVRKCKTSNSSK